MLRPSQGKLRHYYRKCVACDAFVRQKPAVQLERSERSDGADRRMEQPMLHPRMEQPWADTLKDTNPRTDDKHASIATCRCTSLLPSRCQRSPIPVFESVTLARTSIFAHRARRKLALHALPHGYLPIGIVTSPQSGSRCRRKMSRKREHTRRQRRSKSFNQFRVKSKKICVIIMLVSKKPNTRHFLTLAKQRVLG